jgi:hypothetical protein
VGKLLADRVVSKEIIKTTLLRGWKILGTSTFKVLGENLFIIQFIHEWDKSKVLDGRPWIFEGNLFAVEDFDGFMPPTQLVFDKAAFWVRMLNLPLACMTKEIGIKIGSSVGEVEEVDVLEEGVEWGEFLRVRVVLDLTKPLARGRILKDSPNRRQGYGRGGRDASPAVRPNRYCSPEEERSRSTAGSRPGAGRFRDATPVKGGVLGGSQINPHPDLAGVKSGNARWDQNGSSDRVTAEFGEGINIPPPRSFPSADSEEGGGKRGVFPCPKISNGFC